MIRILLADDQRLVRAGFAMMCEAASDIEVVGEAADGAAAVRSAAELRPEVILMDLRMPGLDGTAATRQLVDSGSPARVLVLTTFDDDEHLFPALAAGAAGFLLKDIEPDELLAAIRTVASGEMVMSASVLRRVVGRAVRAGAAGELDPLELTDREVDVLHLVGAGLGNQEIAQQLHLSVSTVKSHIANLMRKTGCDNRVRLAVCAVRRELAGQ